MSDTEKQVLRAIETYKSAVLAKNAETFMHLYDPQVRVFDTWGVWSYEGSGGVENRGRGLVLVTWNRKRQGHVRERARHHCARLCGNECLRHLRRCFRQGQEIRSMQNRISWVLKTSGHVLRIVHEHTSAPIAFEDSTAILQRAGIPGQAGELTR